MRCIGTRARRLRDTVPAALLCILAADPALADPVAAPTVATPATVLAGLAGSPPGTPTAASTPMWPDDRFHRVAALALIRELQAALLSENSATLTLESWCRRHRIAPDPRIVADPSAGRTAPLDADGRALLGIAATEPVRYRHVRLRCGDIVLSEADNWYVPSRLTPDMNQVLDTTHTPFGKAIAALGFTRATLASRTLWSPLPPDWADTPDDAPAPAPGHGHPAPLAIPDTLLENRALLRDRDGRPLALLVERYRAGILAFPPPKP